MISAIILLICFIPLASHLQSLAEDEQRQREEALARIAKLLDSAKAELETSQLYATKILATLNRRY